MSEFQGFAPETIAFLADIRSNNNKRWFEQHRSVYETYVLNPLKSLTIDLAPTISQINPGIEVRPQIGKTISRVFRDTRFSKDKSPLRSHMWLTFKEPQSSQNDQPVFYFFIEPERWGYGMGFWEAGRESMNQFRRLVERNLAQFQKIIDDPELKKRFELAGPTYKRPVTPDLPEDVRKYTERKSFYLGWSSEDLTLTYSPDIATTIAANYEILAPVYLFVMHALKGYF